MHWSNERMSDFRNFRKKNKNKKGASALFFVDRYHESLYNSYVIKREEQIMKTVNTTIRPMTQAERQRAVEVVQVQGKKY